MSETGRASNGPSNEGDAKSPWGFIVVGLIIAGVGSYAFYYATSRSRVDEEALLHGTLIGTFGLLLLATGLSRAAGRVAGAAFAISALIIPTTAYYFAAEREADGEEAVAAESSMYDALLLACMSDQAIDGAGAYDGAPGIHPIAIFSRSSNREWMPHRNQTREGWEPGSVGKTELIACVRTYESLLEHCSYSGTSGRSQSVRRLRYSAEYTLYSAADHRLLARGSFVGSDPGPCPGTLSAGSPGHISGSYPASSEVPEALRPWVEGSERSTR